MTRRHFGLLIGACVRSAQSAASGLDLSGIPNFCAHEHWGSIDSIGRVPGVFRADAEAGATPRGKTGLLDLLLEPYLRGLLLSSGATVELHALKKLPVWDALTELRSDIEDQQFTGTFQCTRRGLSTLYGIDCTAMDKASCEELDSAISGNYQNLFQWYRKAMSQMGFSELVRPVHPEFYVQRESDELAAHESSFTHTVMRIDPFLSLWQKESPRRDRLAEITGIEPVEGKSWRELIGRCFDLAAGGNCVGIKQLQAYSRDLDFSQPDDSDVAWSGDLTDAQIKVFQDWVVHECSKQANDRDWPQQVHVGTHNLTQSSPMPLLSLARRYGRMKIVMIHCWPFLEQAGWLAKYQSNIYIDTCWQPVLSPGFLRDTLRLWLSYVPAHKITCSHDSTTIEMAAGSSLFTREILSDCLSEMNRDVLMPETKLLGLATELLQNNAVRLYGIGKFASIGSGRPT